MHKTVVALVVASGLLYCAWLLSAVSTTTPIPQTTTNLVTDARLEQLEDIVIAQQSHIEYLLYREALVTDLLQFLLTPRKDDFNFDDHDYEVREQ